MTEVNENVMNDTFDIDAAINGIDFDSINQDKMVEVEEDEVNKEESSEGSELSEGSDTETPTNSSNTKIKAVLSSTTSFGSRKCFDIGANNSLDVNERSRFIPENDCVTLNLSDQVSETDFVSFDIVSRKKGGGAGKASVLRSTSCQLPLSEAKKLVDKLNISEVLKAGEDDRDSERAYFFAVSEGQIVTSTAEEAYDRIMARKPIEAKTKKKKKVSLKDVDLEGMSAEELEAYIKAIQAAQAARLK